MEFPTVLDNLSHYCMGFAYLAIVCAFARLLGKSGSKTVLIHRNLSAIRMSTSEPASIGADAGAVSNQPIASISSRKTFAASPPTYPQPSQHCGLPPDQLVCQCDKLFHAIMILRFKSSIAYILQKSVHFVWGCLFSYYTTILYPHFSK